MLCVLCNDVNEISVTSTELSELQRGHERVQDVRNKSSREAYYSVLLGKRVEKCTI